MNTYDHYIAVDWAQSNMAIARMTKCSDKISVIDVPTSIKEFQVYLSQLKGRKILTFEETTTSQWIYTELKSYVDDILVCDPYRNYLLKEGAKTDPADAKKLVQLLRAGMLKPVFHSGEEFVYLRKIVSGYIDVVKAGVRLKNQRSALFRAVGKDKREKTLERPAEKFVLKGIDRAIGDYEIEKKRYEERFENIYKKYAIIKNLSSLPGIGLIGAVKIAAIVIDGNRFKEQGKYWVYCGLVKYRKISGGKDYGSRNARYCRTLKSVYKIATLNVIGSNVRNKVFKNYYEYLRAQKGYADHDARNAVARKIASVSLGIMKHGNKFEPGRLKCNQTT